METGFILSVSCSVSFYAIAGEVKKKIKTVDIKIDKRMYRLMTFTGEKGLFFLIPTEYGFQSDLVSEYFLRLVVSL